MGNKIELSAPWETYWNEICELFNQDPEIELCFDRSKNDIQLHVESTDKADALARILPESVNFGNVKLTITVIPANSFKTKEKMYAAAFRDNPNFCFATQTANPNVPSLTYVVFQPKVAQFFNDNLQDYYGNKNMLIQDAAKDVLKQDPEVCFCTERAVDEENG